MNSVDRNMSDAFIDALVAPSSLFRVPGTLDKYGHIILMIIILFLACSQYLFIANMSDEHLLSEQMSQMTDLSNSEQAVVRDMLEKNVSNTEIFVSGMQSIGLLAQVLVLSVYMLLMAKIRQLTVPFGFKHAFAIVSVCFIPVLAYSLGLILLTLTASSPDLPLSVASFASLNELMLKLDQSDALYTWAKSISLFDFWVLILLGFAFKHILKFKAPTAFVLAFAPYTSFYLAWFLLA